MAGLLSKTVFGAAKFTTKYVVVPILYTALLGYLMQEASQRIREGGARDGKHAVDEELLPTR